jgi:hypothetical protein
LTPEKALRLFMQVHPENVWAAEKIEKERRRRKKDALSKA